MAIKFSRLTRTAVRSLLAGEKITEHGITAECQKNGDCRYSINIMVDGQRIHRVIGRKSDGTTRAQAEEAIETLRTHAREDRLDLPKGKKIHLGFEKAAQDYLLRIHDHSKHGKNLARKRAHISRLSRHFSNDRLDKLTDLSISQYRRKRKDDGAAEATINRELSTLSHFLNRCLEWGWAKWKPAIIKGQEPRKKITVLDSAQADLLVQAALTDHDPDVWLFVIIGLNSGMRHSEILRIRWDEIDFSRRRIFVSRAKAGERTQPIPSYLAERLKKEWVSLGSPEGYLFETTRSDAKSPHRLDMAKPFQRAVKSAGLDPVKVTPHVLRHTAITSLVQGGVDLPTIQRISGHKTLAMVLRYTHLADDHVDRAVEKLSANLTGQPTPKLHTIVEQPKESAA